MARKPGWTLGSKPVAIAASLGILARADDGVMEAASVLQNEWTQLLKQEGSGKIYPENIRFITLKDQGRVIALVGEEDLGREDEHQASAPDEPPATDRGTLSTSIGIDPSGPKVKVGSPLEHARYLEWGVDDHPGNITIAPRPHARPAADRAKEQMTDAVIDELKGGG